MTFQRKRDRIWANLLDDHCPHCGGPVSEEYDGGRRCLTTGCEFYITPEKYYPLMTALREKARKNIVGVKKVNPDGTMQFKPTKTRKPGLPRPALSEILKI